MGSHSTIVSYVLFILSCTRFQFGFLCSLFGLFCCSDTNTPRPCSTDTIGGSHRFQLIPVAHRTSRDNGGAPSAPAKVCPSIPPQSHPHPIQYVRPIQPLASQFPPLYQPVHKNPISLSKPEQTNTIQSLL